MRVRREREREKKEKKISLPDNTGRNNLCQGSAFIFYKSLCVRDKAEDFCWMPVVFRPSDDTASLIGMILSLTLLNGPRNTSRNHCRITRHAIYRCQLKLYHAKRKPYVNMVQKRRRVLWAKAHLRWPLTSKMTTNSSAAGNLYQARMGPNSNQNSRNS